MTNLQLMRLNRVQNVILLSLTTQSQGKAGWTLTELCSACNSTASSLRPFVNRMIALGYVEKSSSTTYLYSRKITSENVNRIAQMIVDNWGTNIYRKNVSEKLKEFTISELEEELSRRKKALKNV